MARSERMRLLYNFVGIDLLLTDFLGNQVKSWLVVDTFEMTTLYSLTNKIECVELLITCIAFFGLN